jgi:hypothetical protein
MAGEEAVAGTLAASRTGFSLEESSAASARFSRGGSFAANTGFFLDGCFVARNADFSQGRSFAARNVDFSQGRSFAARNVDFSQDRSFAARNADFSEDGSGETGTGIRTMAMSAMVTMTSVPIVERQAAIPVCQAWRPASPADENANTPQNVVNSKSYSQDAAAKTGECRDTVERRLQDRQGLSGHPVEFPMLVYPRNPAGLPVEEVENSSGFHECSRASRPSKMEENASCCYLPPKLASNTGSWQCAHGSQCRPAPCRSSSPSTR